MLDVLSFEEPDPKPIEIYENLSTDFKDFWIKPPAAGRWRAEQLPGTLLLLAIVDSIMVTV